ncbi:MAG: right-handed parallel beta-helix repeat-containing protein, partial [Prevotella sp.]|nr:right-handed parallel beta-helix repeat-containing protein [Prevotella sp.]
MKKITSITLTLFLVALTALADTYQTAGDGTTWTLSKLAAVAESGITQAGNTFTMTESVEIVSGDRFEIESGVKVMMADKVQLRISCDADFTATERVLFTATDTESQPYGIYLSNDNSATAFRNIDFEYAGIRCFGAYGADITDCTFKYHNAVSGTAALSLGASGAQFSVTGCTFEKNARCAIAGAANFCNPVTITDCVFEGNGTDNKNYPQMNLTVAENVVIR